MVNNLGLKVKLPLLSVVMVTAWVAPVTAVVAVGVVLPPPLPYFPPPYPLPEGVLEDELVVAAGVAAAPVFVELLPQAAKSSREPNTNRQNETNVVGLVVLV